MQVEKRIRHFYNSIQITGEGSERCKKEMHLLQIAALSALALAAVVVVAEGVMRLCDAVGDIASECLEDACLDDDE